MAAFELSRNGNACQLEVHHGKQRMELSLLNQQNNDIYKPERHQPIHHCNLSFSALLPRHPFHSSNSTINPFMAALNGCSSCNTIARVFLLDVCWRQVNLFWTRFLAMLPLDPRRRAAFFTHGNSKKFVWPDATTVSRHRSKKNPVEENTQQQKHQGATNRAAAEASTSRNLIKKQCRAAEASIIVLVSYIQSNR